MVSANHAAVLCTLLLHAASDGSEAFAVWSPSHRFKKNFNGLKKSAVATDSADDTINLLNSKLRVLEDVVTELMHQRDTMKNRTDEADAGVDPGAIEDSSIRSQSEKFLETRVLEMEAAMLEMQSKHKEEVNLLNKQLADKEDESNKVAARQKKKYESKISQLEESIESLTSEQVESAGLLKAAAQDVKRIVELEETLKEQRESRKLALKELKDELESTYLEQKRLKDDYIARLERRVARRDTRIESLEAQILDMQEQGEQVEEQIQIAQAAVDAAEDRENVLSKEVKKLKSANKQISMQMKVQWMSLKEVVKENTLKQEKIEKLDNVLQATKVELAELQESIKDLENLGVGGRIKSMIGRKKSPQ